MTTTRDNRLGDTVRPPETGEPGASNSHMLPSLQGAETTVNTLADTERSGAKSDRGAVLVEFGLVAILLLFIIIGIFESGIAFWNHLTVSQATQQGARVGAFAGNDPEADCMVVQQVAESLGAHLAALDEIQIYRASPTDGSQIAGQTNTWRLNGDPSDCDLGWSKTQPWDPTSRQVILSGDDKLDIIGVRVLVDRSWVTGFPPFRGDYVINRHTIIRLEPKAFE